ncbi:MAG: HAMP domain-containing histidine kinase [Actinobacteria bacterium]|nr:HAMP domain-containing histidine kinase [Actinomycetota bacterium]
MADPVGTPVGGGGGGPIPVPNPAAPGATTTEGGTGPADRPTEPTEPGGRGARGLVRLVDALPDWMGSVRFRLTALYSLVLFGLAAFMVAGLYAVLASRLSDEGQYLTRDVTVVQEVPGGFTLTPTQLRTRYQTVEQAANERALGLLRSYSLSALAILFFASLIVGWIVAGRVLAPIGRITAVARDIQATDLSRRIALRGPPDELKELADTFDAMLARLDEAFEGQHRFIQEASHELRNPLAVIRTNLDVALADPDPDPAELRRCAELVERTAARMSTLVDDLLVYARQGAPERDLGPVDLGEIVGEAVEDFDAPARARDLAIRGAAPPGLVVHGDRIALRRAVANLLTNAVRVAPSGTAITVTAGPGEGDVGPWLAVADEGPGIAPEDRDLVFRRFWRGDEGHARGERRSGLGLAIVDQVIRDHHGTVTLDANDSGGSTFTLRFPRGGSQELLG